MMKKKLILSLLLVSSAMFNVAWGETPARVYECRVNGERVFSDQVCAEDAVEREISVASRMDSVKVSNDKVNKAKAPSSSRKKSNASSDDHDKRRQQCARIQKSRDALIEKMRAGYTAKQDERLHDRLRKLDNDYFQLRCSGVR